MKKQIVSTVLAVGCLAMFSAVCSAGTLGNELDLSRHVSSDSLVKFERPTTTAIQLVDHCRSGRGYGGGGYGYGGGYGRGYGGYYAPVPVPSYRYRPVAIPGYGGYGYGYGGYGSGYRGGSRGGFGLYIGF